MIRKYTVMPCPNCARNRVWSQCNNAWECPDCHWPVSLRDKRIREIEQARQRYLGIRDYKTNKMKWTAEMPK